MHDEEFIEFLQFFPVSYRTRPFKQLIVWSNLMYYVQIHSYQHCLLFDETKGYGVILNDEFLRRCAPNCLLTIASFAENPNPKTDENGRYKIEIHLNQLGLNELVVLWDLFGREVPIIAPKSSKIRLLELEYLVHYLNIAPFHLCLKLEYIIVTPWFKPYPDAIGQFILSPLYGLLHYNRDENRLETVNHKCNNSNKDEEIQQLRFPIRMKLPSFFQSSNNTENKCELVQLFELKWMISVLDDKLTNFYHETIKSDSIINCSLFDYETINIARYWSVLFPFLMEHIKDIFFTSYILDKLPIISLLARDFNLDLLKSKPIVLCKLIVESALRFDMFVSVLRCIDAKKFSYSIKRDFWLYSANFASLFDTQSLLSWLFESVHFDESRYNHFWTSAFQVACVANNTKLLKQAILSPYHRFEAIRVILVHPNVQSCLNICLQNEDSISILQRLIAFQPIFESTYWSYDLTKLISFKESLFLENEEKCLVAMMCHSKHIPKCQMIQMINRLSIYRIQRLLETIVNWKRSDLLRLLQSLQFEKQSILSIRKRNSVFESLNAVDKFPELPEFQLP